MDTERKGALLFKGNPIDLVGAELAVGDPAPTGWTLTANDMSPVTAADVAGKTRVICTVPSLDTPVCDTEMKRFNREAAGLTGVDVYAVSVDLPFAQKRWCGANDAANVKALSDYREREFGRAWGVWMPSLGIHARAVFVVGKDDKLRHVEYVKEVTSEPDYDAALAAARADG